MRILTGVRTASKTRKIVFGFVAILMGILCWSLAEAQRPVASFFYDEQGRVTRQERDRNGDGKIDLWIFYNQDGQLERVEHDENFDGKPDIFFFYREGNPIRQEISSGRDGRVDRIV
jgi:hypothetical protein